MLDGFLFIFHLMLHFYSRSRHSLPESSLRRLKESHSAVSKGKVQGESDLLAPDADPAPLRSRQSGLADSGKGVLRLRVKLPISVSPRVKV